MAQRIHACLSAKDSVARWGGDEFTILLPQINSAEDPTKVAKDILTSLKEPFPLDNLQLRIRASIGISLFPQDGHDAETLIKHADAALYRTKENGRNNYSFYRPNMTSIASNLLKLENLLHQAIEEKQLSLYYQPQINVTTGQVFGMEALLRWHHPDLGAVSPARFIPLAEETNLIIPIGEWVLKTACAQSREWQQAGLPNLRVAVNLSPLQFQQANLVEMIAQNLANTNLTSDYLEVEVTETTLMQNVDFARQVLHELQDMGIQISMDDFGTGYSSLSYLKNLPFHAIKIDQSFIRDLKNAPQDKAIISAIIALGRGFELRVIAEGVETPEQMELLRSLHCNEMQGYWFSHPLPPAEATAFLLRQQQCQTQPLRTVENADESMSAPPGWEAIH
ncbi:MAG: bifunctional diguanylate cyclase/phosphodiesterase [Cyanobacteria bacterium P01_H01_bin.15]